MKKRKLIMCIGIIFVCAIACTLSFKIGTAQSAAKVTQFNKYRDFKILDSDGTYVDGASSYQIEDPETGAVYFAHTQAVQVLVGGKLKWKNVIVVDSPRYWPEGNIVVLK